MLKLTTQSMARAIERAKAVHPKVKVISAADRTYSVSGSKGAEYTVRFVVANGHKLAECDCPAGRREQMCYHVASAAALNVGVRSGYGVNSNPADALSIGQLIVETAKYYPYGHGYLV